MLKINIIFMKIKIFLSNIYLLNIFMKIIDINDIEDIVIAKIEIDKNDPNVKGRSNLNEFIQKYCTLSDILVINNSYKAFKYISCFGNQYLFLSNKDDENDILIFLKNINYNFNSLKEFDNFSSLSNPNIQMLIHDNKYYQI